jgi:tripartite-type tricarboxylate transporter receptor subunit TctC
VVLKKKCAAIDTIVQYRPGGGDAVLWSSMNSMPGDGLNVMALNLPHQVLQPMEGTVQYKTENITPVCWYHDTPDALVVPERSPIKSVQEFIQIAKATPGRFNIGGSALNSAKHAAHTRLGAEFGIVSTCVPCKGTGDLANAVLGGQLDGAMSYTAFAINNKTRVRALAVAMDKPHPLLPDVPTFKELGVNWVDGAYRGIGVPKSTPVQTRRKLAELFAALNADPEMKEFAFKSGFELIDVGPDKMDAFMKVRIAVYTAMGQRMGLGRT